MTLLMAVWSTCHCIYTWPTYTYTLGHTFSYFLCLVLLQPCPATYTLLNLSCPWLSKLSWRQIPTLSEYYSLCTFQHQCPCNASERHMSLTWCCHRVQTLCVGSRGLSDCGQQIFQFAPINDSDFLGVWWEWQLVIGWATGGGMVEYVSVMYTYNINLRCSQLVEATAIYVRVMPQTQTLHMALESWSGFQLAEIQSSTAATQFSL